MVCSFVTGVGVGVCAASVAARNRNAKFGREKCFIVVIKKSEIRISKSEANPKSETGGNKQTKRRCFGFSSFAEIRVCFGFRNSDFRASGRSFEREPNPTI